MNIAIIILAAGKSNRMGKAKQLLPVGKTTLLGITIKNALKANTNKVYCVLGAKANSIVNSISKYDVEIILNSNYQTGLSSSIVAAIKHIKDLNFDAVLILLGDQPLISDSYMNQLIDTYNINFNKEPIVASLYETANGVPAVIPKKHFSSLLRLKGDKGAKDFLNSKKETLISLKNKNLIDIDTIQDYEAYIKSSNFE